jgi:hypothetical protein
MTEQHTTAARHGSLRARDPPVSASTRVCIDVGDRDRFLAVVVS